MSATYVPLHLYYPYALWVALKQRLGISCARHRSFYLMKIMRALDAGRITGKLNITSAGKSDGVGAQSIARISAQCFANAYGLTYVHTPFETLAHAELPMPEWISTWERLLLLGEGAPQVADSSLPIIDLETYANNPTLWKTDCLLTTRHYHTFCKLAPHSVESVARDLQDRFRRKYVSITPHQASPLSVCLHIRRGDVRPDDAQTKHRFSANESIAPLVEEIRAVIASVGRTCKIRLYSQGKPKDFTEFDRIPDLELRLDTSALDTFRDLADADILLMAQSDFSYTAALYCDGIKICDPRHRVPLAEWVQINPTSGRLDSALLRKLILTRHKPC